MTSHAIISYDDTPNDHDALMLGRVLRNAGAKLSLAYVRHFTEGRADREQLAEHDAEALLERGAAWLEDTYVDRHVVVSGSTPEGLAWLAARITADIIVFGSDYRTRVGHVAVGRSAEVLLQNGPTALALAPAGYASEEHRIATIGVLPGTADEAAIETAYAIAKQHDAKVTDRASGVDLLVVGSRAEARHGRTMITSSAANVLEDVTAPVLIVARGAALSFETLVTV